MLPPPSPCQNVVSANYRLIHYPNTHLTTLPNWGLTPSSPNCHRTPLATYHLTPLRPYPPLRQTVILPTRHLLSYLPLRQPPSYPLSKLLSLPRPASSSFYLLSNLSSNPTPTPLRLLNAMLPPGQPEIVPPPLPRRRRSPLCIYVGNKVTWSIQKKFVSAKFLSIHISLISQI